MSVSLDYELLNLVSSKGIDNLKELAYLGIVFIIIIVLYVVVIII